MKILTEDDILKQFIKQASNEGVKTEDQLHRLKKKFAKAHKMQLPTNFKLQKAYEALIKEGWEGNKELQKITRKRKVRTLSGVSVITVLTKPYPCPGKCVFCPTEPGMPKSYLSNEPGAMRAVLDDFHPKDQVATRIDSLTRQGHETDKIEMIVLGGTFSAYNRRYQKDYVRALYNACNKGIPKEWIKDGKDISEQFKTGRSLVEAQKINESAKHKLIGLSLETRPDHITEEEVAWMRELGCTKVQIGVQHINNEVLDYNKRGEKIEDSIKAMRIMKDAGLKIATHLMPNLPGSTPEMDVDMVKQFFENPDFKPDQLKIYPCVVTPYAELEQWWKEGRYKAYDDETLMRILVQMKQHIPRYVRLERLFRDIPGETILEGSQKTNMRQLLHDQMKKDGVTCECIRCHEIKGESYDPNETELRIQEYEANQGKEFFISFNDSKTDKLCSLLRLRFSSLSLKGLPHFIPELEGAALVREVHTYGQQVRVGESDSQNRASQHAGLGRRMIIEAERISKEAGYKKVAIIAGVGTRNYYRKWGYELEGSYMTKEI